MNTPDDAEEAARHPWGRAVRRAGWAAKGTVYLLIAFLCLQIAFGNRSGTATAQGAFELIAQRSFGTAMLVVIAVGLLAFSLDRFLTATVLAAPDEEHVKRLATFGTGVAYLVLAGLAALTTLRGGNSGGGNPTRPTATLLSLPFGTWLVGAVGIGLLVFALSELRHAARGDATDALQLSAFSPRARRVVGWLESAGISGHGLAFGLIGYFVIQSAVTHNPRKAESLDGALLRLAGEPYGTALISVTAVGLLLYGAHCLIQARWRRLRA